MQVDLLLAAAANGRERLQDSTQDADRCVALRVRRDKFWMCGKPQHYELNITKCGSARKQIGASRETAGVALAWTSEQNR